MEDISALWSNLLDDFRDALPGGLKGFDIDFENRVCLEPVGASVKQFAAAALLRSIPKKWQGNIDQVAADQAAWDLFHEMNSRCRDWSPNPAVLGPYDEVVLGEILKTCWEFFNPEGYSLLDFAAIEAGVDFGPGSGPGARDNSYLDKVGHSKLTASVPLIVDLFDQWVRANPSRVDCEITRTLACGSPRVVEANKMTCVPKTAKISRLVSPEPLLNMFFQKGCQRLLENRLQEFFGIDLKSQPALNAALAKRGSIRGDLCTLDLKSASDCISMKLCELLIPRSSLRWLKLFRSHAKECQGKIVPLAMIATMGNAFCFPLQTAIFASIVKGVYTAMGLPFNRVSYEVVYRSIAESGEVEAFKLERQLPSFGVFGDDIVVVKEAFETVKRILRYFGFIPNTEKSFGPDDGSFRESCGSDYYLGANCRGVYATRLETPQDWYVLINSLTDWSARVNIPLTGTIAWCLKQVQRCEVPPWENPDAGIRMPLCCVRTKDVFRAVRPQKDGLAPHYQGSYLYKRWVPEDVSFEVSYEAAAERNLYWNSSAIFQSAIKGVLRGGRVSLRMWETPYHKRLGVAPCWDYMGQEDLRSDVMSSWYGMARVYYGS